MSEFVSWPCVSTPKLKQNAFFGDSGSFVIVLAISAGAAAEPLSVPSPLPFASVVHAIALPVALSWLHAA